MISFAKRERAQRAAAVVGVDAGKFSHTLVVRPRGQPDSKPHTFQTTRTGFDEAVAFIRQAADGASPETILVGIEFAGNYGFTFAHYLGQLGFPVVSVLAAHTKRWKDVAHNQPLKTDAKDAATITDLLAQGHFVAFPFLEPAYADLRYLAAGRERLSLLRRGALTQLRTLLQVVFPEFEALFPLVTAFRFQAPRARPLQALVRQNAARARSAALSISAATQEPPFQPASHPLPPAAGRPTCEDSPSRDARLAAAARGLYAEPELFACPRGPALLANAQPLRMPRISA